MRSTWILLCCLSVICLAKEFDQISETSKKFRALHFECKSKRWYCQRECRIQFFETSGSCRKPRADENCFGAPITYNYTWNHAVQHFPQEYELFKRFPSCWSVLGPLLCASIYRPCSTNEYFEAGKSVPGMLELWQVYPKRVCETARNACPFLVETGMWPSFLNCEEHVSLKDSGEPQAITVEQSRKIFSPNSACAYTAKSTTFPMDQCLWPLIAGPDELKHASGHRAEPLMDSCYMPCETPLAGFNWVLEHFRQRNSFIAGITGAVFLLITIYLIGFSKIYTSSLSIFCLGQAFLCVTAYLVIWWLSGFPGFRNVAMCIDNGRIRRHPRINLLDSCALEAIFLTCTIVSAYFWLFAIILLRILRPRIRNDNYFSFGQRGNEYSARIWLAAIIYLLPLTIVGGMATILWNELPMDVFSGLCHIAAGSTQHSMAYYGSIIGAMVVTMAVGIGVGVQLTVQKYRLYHSMRQPDATVNRQSLLISSIEEGGHELPRNLTAETTYAREHGLGDGLISDIWLGSVFGAIALSLGIGLFLQFGVLADSVGKDWERRKVAESLKCSLSSIKEVPPYWWNRTLHHDDITRETDPFVRKAQLFNAATAPGCNMVVVGDPQLVALFLTAIILPSLPFWILSVCFLAGFCDNGLLSVRKIRRNLNPFIREKQKLQKLDTFLIAEEKPLKKEENIELESIAATAISAPARLQVEKTEIDSNSHDETIEEDAKFGSASVKSEPTVSREPRKLDLNKKRNEHRRDRKQYMERLKTQSRTLFSMNPTVPLSFASIPSQYTALSMPSTANMISASQHMPFMLPVPTADPTLIKYIDELKNSQKQQALQINNLTRTVNHAFSKFEEYTEVVARQSVSHVSSANLTDDEDTEVVVHYDSRQGRQGERSHEKIRLTGRAIPPPRSRQLINTTPAMPAQAVVVQNQNGDDIVLVPANPIAMFDEDWHLPAPPHVTIELWEQLQRQYDPNEEEEDITVEEIQINLVLRLIEHCREFLPLWLHKHFKSMIMAEYDDIFAADTTKFAVFEQFGLYPDTESTEAAADNTLYQFIFPMAGKAVRRICEQCHIDPNIVKERLTTWITDADELARFYHILTDDDGRSTMEFSDISSVTEFSDIDMNESEPFILAEGTLPFPDAMSTTSANGINGFASSGGSSDSSECNETVVKRRRIDDGNALMEAPRLSSPPDSPESKKENVAPPSPEVDKTAVVRPLIVESVPFNDLTPMPSDANRDYFQQVTSAYVSSMMINGFVHPPMAPPGHKYVYYIFNFENPASPSKIFFEEKLMDEKDVRDAETQRRAIATALNIVRNAAPIYGRGSTGDPDPTEPVITEPPITFPADIQAMLERYTTTPEGVAPFTLEELYPDRTVRDAMTPDEIVLAMEPMFQACYVQSCINIHVKGVLEPYRRAALRERDANNAMAIVNPPTRQPVDFEAMVSERIDEVPEEEELETA